MRGERWSDQADSCSAPYSSMIFSKTCVHLHHDRHRHETGSSQLMQQESGLSQPLMAEFMTALPHINEQSFLPTSSITRSGAVPAGSPSSSLDMISGPPPQTTSSANNVSHPLQSMIKIEDPLTPSLSPPTDPGTPGQADFAWMKEKKTGRKQSSGKKGASLSSTCDSPSPESPLRLRSDCIRDSRRNHHPHQVSRAVSAPATTRSLTIMTSVLSAPFLQPVKTGSPVACGPHTHLTNSWNWKRNFTSTNTCAGPDGSKSRQLWN